jgi:hypothetical protein
MSRRLLWSSVVVLIVGISLPVGVYLYLRAQLTTKPSWLKQSALVTYEQFFSWAGHSQTENMTWNITGLRDDSADVHLISHGANITEGNVEITLGEVNFRFSFRLHNSTNPKMMKHNAMLLALMIKLRSPCFI